MLPEKRLHRAPTAALIWLGILIDVLNRLLSIPEQKILKIRALVNELLWRNMLSPRELLKFAGMMNSMAAIIGPKAYIKTKPLFHEVNMAEKDSFHWDMKRKISADARQCLQFWKEELHRISFQAPIDRGEKKNILFSDASTIRGAAFLYAESVQTVEMEMDIQKLEDTGPLDWSKAQEDMSIVSWSTEERTQSSTWREVKTTQTGL